MSTNSNQFLDLNPTDLIQESDNFTIWNKQSIIIITSKPNSEWKQSVVNEVYNILNSLDSNNLLNCIVSVDSEHFDDSLYEFIINKISSIPFFIKGALVYHDCDQLTANLKTTVPAIFMSQWEFYIDTESAWKSISSPILPLLIEEIKKEYKEEDIYKQIINTAPAILYSCSLKPPFELQFISEKIEEFGVKIEESLQKKNFWIEHVHVEDLSEFYRAFENCSATQTNNVLFRFIDSYGDHRWFKNSFRYIKDERNVTLWIAGFLLDVTSEINQRDTLKEQRIFLNSLLSSISEGLCGVDLDGNIIFINPAGCEMLGYTEQELIGYSFLSMGFHLKDNGEMRLFKGSILQQTIKDGKTRPSDPSIFWRKDRSELHVEFTVSPLIRDNNRIGAIISFTDITEKRKAAATIEAQRATMINSSKLSALGEMAGGVAHEINNPVAGIQGKAYQLMRMLDANKFDGEKFKTDLKKIYDTADRIAKIVKGLKAFSRNADKDPFEMTLAKKLITETLDFTRERLISHSIKIEIVESTEDCPIFCRATQLIQVLISLVNNSYDAISTLSDKWIKIETATKNGNVVLIAITDSGLGIKPEIAQKVMQPFFTTKGVGKGVGLGLSVASGIISEHGGKFYLDDQCPNTRFVIELPLATSKQIGKIA